MIKDIIAREILDSRGVPTVEADLILEDGTKVTASVPSGASTGANEALELRDGDERFHGQGVLKAVNNVNTTIKEALVGQKLNQEKLDRLLIELDGTENKRKLGANAILAASLVIMKAIAKTEKKELYETLGDGRIIPRLMVNIMNGGAHASSGLEIQEFMIVPNTKNYSEDLRCASEVFHSLKILLEKDKQMTTVGDEGGFAPRLKKNEHALNYIVKAIEHAGYKPGKDVFIALDSAATEFYHNGKYKINKKLISKEKLINYYLNLIEKYPIISIEDAFAEDDVEPMKELTRLAGKDILLVGDDFFVTNTKYLEDGIKNKYNNSILLKPNQIGTITEMKEAINLAKDNNFKTVISHRSGETEDNYIADIGVGFNIDYIKTGSVSRSERLSKYNRLLRIEEHLNKKTK